MTTILVLAAMTAIFILGRYLMKRLDDFLAGNPEYQRQTQQSRLPSCKNALRIGFSNPLAAGSLSDAMESFSIARPDISICLFSGTEEEIINEFSAHRLDLIFLSETTGIPEGIPYHTKKFSLPPSPVLLKYADLPIEPVTGNCLSQKILWSSEEKTPFVKYFADCLSSCRHPFEQWPQLRPYHENGSFHSNYHRKISGKLSYTQDNGGNNQHNML